MDFQLPFVEPGYVITINEDGLSKLTLNDVVLGEGVAQLLNGGWFYTLNSPTDLTPAIASKSVEYTADGAVVTHEYTGALTAKVVYTYTVNDSDVSVACHVANTGATAFQPAFRSMRFNPWSGGYTVGFNYNQDHTQANPKLSYPSANVPFGASVISSTVGGLPLNVATWSAEDPHEKFMSVLIGIFPLDGYAIANIFFPAVPPSGSRIYKLAFRFLATSTQWQDLLGGYKEHLRSAFPEIAYEPNARPIVQFAAIDSSYIRPDNPYGYNDGGDGITRRFDKLEGCQDYVARLVGPMSTTGYQGILMWQPQGIHVRGIQYRPDFNSFPTVTLPNLPTLTQGFNAAGLTIGLQARPGAGATSGGDWDHDNPIRLDGGDGTKEDIGWRIDWATAQGFKGFYLDSFIGDGNDHDILAYIRSKVGTDHTFCEFSTALSMAYSAAYEEVTWDVGVVLTQRQQILRWLWPESIVFANPRGTLPTNEELYPAMFELLLTPLVQDFQAWLNMDNVNTILQPLIAEYIDPSTGRWL